MPSLEAVKALVSIMISVSWSNRGKQLNLRLYDVSRVHFQGTAQRLICVGLPAEDRQKYGEDKVGEFIKSMHGTPDASHISQLDHVSQKFWKFPKRPTQRSTVPQFKQRCDDVGAQ